MPKILIIEDDTNINNMISDLLKLNNYYPVSAFTPKEALEKFNKDIDLILLDLMLPNINGQALIHDLKAIKDIPIIVVSAISDIDMKVTLFDLGADDYITKPFNNKELLSRIKVALRHNSTGVELKYQDIVLNDKTYTVTCHSKPLDLSKTEYAILKLLLKNAGQIVTKTTFFDTVWGNYSSADENTLNVHISKIRNKLKQCSNQNYIETVWKVGYRLK